MTIMNLSHLFSIYCSGMGRAGFGTSPVIVIWIGSTGSLKTSKFCFFFFLLKNYSTAISPSQSD